MKRKKVKVDLKRLNEIYHEIKFDTRNIVNRMGKLLENMERLFDDMD